MTTENQGFTTIDPKSFFAERAPFAVWYRKDVCVQARPAVKGESVRTVTSGNHLETANSANEGDMLIVNPGGESYLISGSKFAARYALEDTPNVDAGDGLRTYRAVGAAVPCIRLSLDESVEFTAPWGETMRIKGGGVLVNGGEGDIYGIGAEEFAQTYSPCLADGLFIPVEVWARCYATACDDAKEDWHLLNIKRRDFEVEHNAWKLAVQDSQKSSI